MTAIDSSQIPSSAYNSLESLALYALGALYKLNKNQPYQLSDEEPLAPVISNQIGLAGDKTERSLFSVAIEIDPDWRTNGQPLWEQAVEFSSVAMPSDYLI